MQNFIFYIFYNFNLFSYSKGIQTPGRHVRTRLYFTSESHVHSLLTAIRYGGLLDVRKNLFIEERKKYFFVILRYQMMNNGNVQWNI